MASGSHYLDLNFQAQSDFISALRKLVADYYTPVMQDPDAVERMALAAHEMAENAVRYATDQQSRIRIEFKQEDGVGHIHITTWNHSNADNRDSLRQMMREMNQHADPFDFYQKVMKRSAKRTDGSGMGLARIRSEAEMNVGLKEMDDNVVCIEAEADIDNK